MIKLMSFNIRYGTAEDGENRWDLRKPLVIERIKAFDPDLLGMQECRDDAQGAYVKEHLPDYEFFGVPRGGDSVTSQEMAPLLYKRSNFELIRQGVFWLSTTPQVPGSKSWDSAFPRTATWAELGQSDTGRSLLFLNTHFDYEPETITASARLLKQWIHKNLQNLPLLVTGDFNAEKDSPAYQQMTGGSPPLQDVFRTGNSRRENDGTFHGYGTEIHPPSIDWMLASGHFAVENTSIDRYHEGDLYPSDHYPIRATLDWNTSPK